MRAVVISKHGPPEVLLLVDRPDPIPAEGQVLVEVRAAGVNFADLMMRTGLYPGAPRPPFVPGYEVAGIAEGRRVLAPTRFGGYAEKLCVPRRNVFPLPEGFSFPEGAAIPVVYLTAWCALEELARLRERDRVLVQAAAGGVGLAAIQIARRRTGRITGVVGSESKAEFLRGLGVTPVVRGRDPVGGPFDVILNSAGGRTIREDMARLAPLGRIVCYGASSVLPGRKRSLLGGVAFLVGQPALKPLDLMSSNRGVMGLNLAHLGDDSEALGNAMKEISSGLGTWLKPRVDRTFPLEQAAAAHRYLHDRMNIGKVVLAVA
jgi:NADPH:quinone reductase-like Zn-dependent oxidoreductase